MKTLSDAIIQHPFFRGMKPEHLGMLSEGARQISFKTDDIVFREREPADRFYLIENGKIALEAHEPADGTILIQTLGAGDVLGWSWLYAPFVWHFQARALEPTEVIALSGAHLLVTAEHDQDFGYQLMKRVTKVVINRLQNARKRLLAAEMESIYEG